MYSTITGLFRLQAHARVRKLQSGSDYVLWTGIKCLRLFRLTTDCVCIVHRETQRCTPLVHQCSRVLPVQALQIGSVRRRSPSECSPTANYINFVFCTLMNKLCCMLSPALTRVRSSSACRLLYMTSQTNNGLYCIISVMWVAYIGCVMHIACVFFSHSLDPYAIIQRLHANLPCMVFMLALCIWPHLCMLLTTLVSW